MEGRGDETREGVGRGRGRVEVRVYRRPRGVGRVGQVDLRVIKSVTGHSFLVSPCSKSL